MLLMMIIIVMLLIIKRLLYGLTVSPHPLTYHVILVVFYYRIIHSDDPMKNRCMYHVKGINSYSVYKD